MEDMTCCYSPQKTHGSGSGKIPGVMVCDSVNHPSHYTQGKVECIEAMESAFGAEELAVYCKIAAFKYLWRCKLKNGLEDVKKAEFYIKKYIELLERKDEVG